jgi:hypothetical protein
MRRHDMEIMKVTVEIDTGVAEELPNAGALYVFKMFGEEVVFGVDKVETVRKWRGPLDEYEPKEGVYYYEAVLTFVPDPERGGILEKWPPQYVTEQE